MKAPFPLRMSLLAGVLCSFCLSSALAGQFKRITIDGEFEDWLGVPVAAPDDADADGRFDMKDIAVANDENFLFVRIRLHSPADYPEFNHQVLVDTDSDGGTGHPWGGVGSELFIENGSGYQQKNGQFNEGAGSGLDWAIASSEDHLQFEMRISRKTSDAEGLPFFSGDEIQLTLMARSLEWELTDSVDAVPYAFAIQPQPFVGSKVLTDFQNTFWFYQEVGDPEPDWLLPDYLGDDTWQGGTGFFSFGIPQGQYPVPTQVDLSPGRVTYYFRTPFLWEHAAEGVALQADVLISDGAVIYLNGDEVRRLRMPQGPVDGTTLALGGPENPGQIERISLPASALIVGENLLMVELHQAAGSLDSAAFGFSLQASDSVPPSQEEPGKPEDRAVVEGEGVIFTAGSIAGTEPYTYQWFKDGELLEGQTQARLEIPVVLQEHAGAYSVEISNGSGSLRSRQASLTTSALPVALADETLPSDQVVLEGRPLQLTSAFTGSPEIAYQWYRDDAPIPDATESTLTFEAAAIHSGDYHVTASNRVNTVSSRKARITVTSDASPPQIDELTAGGNTVILTFSEPLRAESAGDASHYLIEGVAVHQAVVSADGLTVTLTTDPLTFSQDYRLTFSGVTDAFGNAANTSLSFRASILIDGDFSDWDALDPVATEPQEADGAEFDAFWVANDAHYLYLRFRFHQEIGGLPTAFFYQIFLDGDDDPATGLSVSTIGSSLMIENGGGWLQAGGAFNEGSVSNTGFLLAPEGPSREFECRISLASSRDGTPIFTADSAGISFNLVSLNWAVVDSGPAEGIRYQLLEWPDGETPPPPARRLSIHWHSHTQVELQWDEGNLESSGTLQPGSWQPVPQASSPLRVDPREGQRFYRLAD